MGCRRYFARIHRISLLAAALLAGCGDTPLPIENRNGGRIDVIGHGGAGLRSRSNPLVGNSLASIRRALDGFRTDGVEVDVQLTADGVPVLFHDAVLDGNTNCTGSVRDWALPKLKRCRLENAYSFGRSKDRIPTLAEALASMAQRVPRPAVYLDVKFFPGKNGLGDDFDARFIGAIDTVLAKYDAYAWVTIQSGRVAFLREARKVFGKRLRMLFAADSYAQALMLVSSLDLDGFIIAQEKITRRQVQDAHARELWVVLFNVQSAVSARHVVEVSPDAVQADNIRVMQEALPD